MLENKPWSLQCVNWNKRISKINLSNLFGLLEKKKLVQNLDGYCPLSMRLGAGLGLGMPVRAGWACWLVSWAKLVHSAPGSVLTRFFWPGSTR